MNDKQVKQKLQTEQTKSALLIKICNHVGAHNAIGMGELYESVFGEPWKHRINDTRALRILVTGLRRSGVPIASTTSQHGGGYYLADTKSELDAYCERLEHAAKRKLQLVAKIRKMSFPEYVGQLAIIYGKENP